MRILYRVRQFWHTLTSETNPQDIEQAKKYLTPEQWGLFDRLQASEKAHALAIVNRLVEQGETQLELVVAALLHDVGKVQYSLNALERALIVVAQAVVPGQARRWGALPPGGWERLPSWRKAFILAENHAEWGAEMARGAGVNPLTGQLIRDHHRHPGKASPSIENRLHQLLWLADNQS